MNGHEKGNEIGANLLRMVGELAAELHPRRAATRVVTMDSSLSRDLGLDSLARVELLVRVGKNLGVSLPERILGDIETPRDLLQAVLQASPAGKEAASREETLSWEEAPMPEGAIPVPHHARTLIDVVNHHVEDHPERPHIRFYSEEGPGEELSYGQLAQGAAAVAAGLQTQGLRPGEPVAIMLPTGKDYFFAFLGILRAGGVPTPIYPPVRWSQLEDHLRRHSAILKNCGAAVIITMPEAKIFAQILKAQVENLRILTTVDELAATSAVFREPQAKKEDTAFLQYTSGSTGNPKGVVLSHANLLANIRAIGAAVAVQAADVVVSWLPLYHDMGLIGAWMCSLYYGPLLVLMSPLSFISRPQRWLQAIHRFRGTISAAPNFAYELCLKRIPDEELPGFDLSSWRAACNGAEPVSPATVDNFCRKFGACGFRREAFMPVYGLAECSVGLTFPPLGRGPLIDRIARKPFMMSGRAIPAGEDDDKALQFVACGRPLPGHEIRILDAAGRELPERYEGMLQFRGPSATSGYYRNAGDTQKLIQGDWLDSGDMAYTAGGDVFITGRKKDIIIRAGRNIYPQEIEAAVGALPGIRKGNVVAFGSVDLTAGEEKLVVWAETREDDPDKLADLRREINALTMDLVETAADDVVLTPPGTILKTSSGKIRRDGNRRLYESGAIGRGTAASWRQIARITAAGVIPELRRLRRAAGEGIYALYCLSLYRLVAPFAWASIMATPQASRRWTLMRKTARFLARATFTPLIVHGLENLPRHRPSILVANHASYIDAYVMVAALPVEFGFVAKAELAGSLWKRALLKRIRTEFVERFDRLKGVEDARRLADAARAGRSLFFFAEGTFTTFPGLLPFHMGAFLAAAAANLPVIPIAIRGTRSILLGETKFPRRGMINVVIGKAIEPAAVGEAGQADVWTRALKLRELAREHILSHCGEPDLANENSPIIQ